MNVSGRIGVPRNQRTIALSFSCATDAKNTTPLVTTIPGIASIGGLLTLFFYIFAIISTQLFGDK